MRHSSSLSNRLEDRIYLLRLWINFRTNPASQMAPKNTYRVEKFVKRLRTISLSLDTEAGRNRIEKLIRELEDEKDAPEHVRVTKLIYL